MHSLFWVRGVSILLVDLSSIANGSTLKIKYCKNERTFFILLGKNSCHIEIMILLVLTWS